jgi:hypothetical protein
MKIVKKPAKPAKKLGAGKPLAKQAPLMTMVR